MRQCRQRRRHRAEGHRGRPRRRPDYGRVLRQEAQELLAGSYDPQAAYMPKTGY
ncbi:hypothetical protein ACFVH9_16400 [Streptomyces hirsutus]|uniref:hypothetical protein n=1 Tax=Streptomyces hirsutus TaxID=35620 RepID=UPI0036306DCB